MFLRFSSGDNFGADSFQRNSFSFLLKEQAKRRFRRFWLGSLFYPLEAGFIFRLCHFPSHLSKAHRIVIAGQYFFLQKKSNIDHDDGDEDNDDYNDDKDYDDDAWCFHISKFYQRGPHDDVNYEANDDDDGEDYNDDAST